MADLDLTWTDDDGAVALFTTDPETCGESDAVAVMAILRDAGTGGVYLKPQDARALIHFLKSALRRVEAAA
jgi:hypothetical protein